MCISTLRSISIIYGITMSSTENNFLRGRIGQFVPKSKRLLIGKIFWDSLHLGFIAKTNYSNTKVGAEHAFLQHANSKF